MENFCGSIYILTNPSFKDYVKIGYSKNVQERIYRLNNSEAVPFAFRLYATYDVETQSADKILHKIIDKLNANLRSVDTVNDKVRVREFYLISPEDAYELLEDIAIISGTKERLHLYKPTEDEVQEEETAEKNRELSKNRHHFKEIKFKSSLTNKTYYSKTKDDGSRSGIKNQIIEPKEVTSHTIYFELPKREDYYKNIIILVFYDDLLENKYMQKLDGCLSVSMNESEYVPGAFVCANEKYEKLGVDFKYELPQEIIDDELKRIEHEEKQKKIIQEIPEKKEIDKMVDEYLEEHKLFFDIIFEYFKGLDFKFGSGGEIEDYKLLRKNLYNIIVNSIDGVNKKEYIQCKIILRVNIKTEEIRCIDWYVKESTLNIKRRKSKRFEKLIKKELKKIKKNESKIYDVKLS